MELLKEISKLEIPTNKISYDKKTKILSIEILKFMFIGIYKKSARVSKILDDIHVSLKEIKINREDIYFLDLKTNERIREDAKLRNLIVLEKKEIEKKEKEKEEKIDKKKQRLSERAEYKMKEEAYRAEEEMFYDEDLLEVADDFGEMQEIEEAAIEDEKVFKREDREMEEAPKRKKAAKPTLAPPPPPATRGAPPPKPAAPPVGGPPGAAPPAPEPTAEPEVSEAQPTVTEAPPAPQPTVYEINMGLQYYSVMMEQRSYLFYVYFSHKELKIVDEEGKVVYETTVRIVTTKEEPPVLDLRIEGEGFEVHPLSGKVEVKKDAVNPPVMIFSILPVKSKKLKRKESERRFLNVYVEFENKVISHSILSIIVQPKHFRLDIGPIHLNISKSTAYIISFISILIAGISVIYALFSIDPTSSGIDILSRFAPGLGSIIFFVIFIVTLIKEGIYPLKEKISNFLNFDQTGVLIK